MAIRAITTTRPISTLSDFPHRLKLQDGLTDQVLATGTVYTKFCAMGTAAELNANARCQLTYNSGEEEWRGVHDAADLVVAFAALPVGTFIDRVLEVAGATTGIFLDRWELVAVAPINAAL